MQRINVNLAGGLGNQIFQYAAGLFFAKATEKQIILNLTNVARSHSEFDISSFQINHELRNSLIVSKAGKIVPYMNIIRNKYRFNRQDHLLDQGYELNISAVMNRNIRSISGYFQDLRYFNSDYDLNLVLKAPSKRYLDYLEYFVTNQIVGVHIRRGDFVGQAKSHGCLSIDWYHKEINSAFQSIREDTKLLVFSDDSQWVETNLIPKIHSDIQWEIISGLELPDPAESWCLLRKAHHLICANSTFSLTAATLSKGSTTVPFPLTRNNNFKDIERSIPKDWKQADSIWEQS